MRHSVFHIVLLFLVSSVPGLCQTWEEVCRNSDYLWGEGWGKSVEEADREALASLGSRVSVAISSSFLQTEDQRVSSSGRDFVSTTSSSLSLQSHTRLSNTSSVVMRKGHRYHVGRWIRRDELEKLFSDRRSRALEYEHLALRAERELRLDAALRYHYWAYVTLSSLNRPCEVRDDDGRMLMVSIPERMNAIFSGLEVTARRSGGMLFLDFRYKGSPVRGLDFSYFDGQRWSALTPVRDGRSSARLAPGALGEIVQLRVEYAYNDEARLDDELGAVMASVNARPFRKANIIFRR